MTEESDRMVTVQIPERLFEPIREHLKPWAMDRAKSRSKAITQAQEALTEASRNSYDPYKIPKLRAAEARAEMTYARWNTMAEILCLIDECGPDNPASPKLQFMHNPQTEEENDTHESSNTPDAVRRGQSDAPGGVADPGDEAGEEVDEGGWPDDSSADH